MSRGYWNVIRCRFREVHKYSGRRCSLVHFNPAHMLSFFPIIVVLPCSLQEDVKKIYVNQDEKNGFYKMFKSHFTIGLIKYVLLNLPYPDYRAQCISIIK